MGLFNNIFGKNQLLITCPRCLGKGNVDWDDIKRLNQELKWIPGSCAYCDGTGKVDKNIEQNVPVDTAYLSTNLPKSERENLIKGNQEALERAFQYENQTDVFIEQICYLHFESNLNSNQIASFFLIGCEQKISFEEEKNELLNYIEKVIQKKKDTN